MPTHSFDITLSHSVDALGLKHVDQYFGPWAIYQPHLEQTLAAIQQMDLKSHVDSGVIAAQEYTLSKGGVAVVSIEGAMTKHGSSMSESGSTRRARRAIRNAVADESVQSILFHIESPGGTVAGTKELADDVRQANDTKRVVAYISDIGASAAYWVASQADAIYANDTAFVGSIGTYMAIADYSGMAEAEGIKVHVIRAGEFKGAGTPGTPISDEMIANWQRLITETNEFFTAAVGDGRGLNTSQIEGLADGRVHLSKQATELGLIDGVRGLDDVLSEMAASRSKGRKRMSETTNEPVAATTAELKTAFPNSDAAWRESMTEAGKTLVQATAAWAAECESKLEAEQKTTAELKAKEQAREAEAKEAAEKEAKATSRNVNTPLADDDDDGNDDEPQVDGKARLVQLVQEERAKIIARTGKNPKMAQAEASKAIKARYPELVAAVLESHRADVVGGKQAK